MCTRHIRPLAPIPTGVRPRLTPVQPCSAMLFDIYGTLLISAAGEIGLNRWDDGVMDALQALLYRHALHRSPRELMDALERTVRAAHRTGRQDGISCPEIDIVQIWQQVLGWNDIEQIEALALEIELIVNPVYPMPGMQALLAACRKRDIRIGLLSNAQFYTPILLEWLLGGTLDALGFDPQLRLFSWREGHAKPSSSMFEKAGTILAAQGILPDAVLYVGNDMRNDILPAATVGFKTALFAGDRRSLRLRHDEPQCRRLDPDLIVTDLGQLIEATKQPRG